jgi:hypothetical protein
MDLKALLGSLIRIQTLAVLFVAGALVVLGVVYLWLDVRAKKSRHQGNKRR